MGPRSELKSNSFFFFFLVCNFLRWENLYREIREGGIDMISTVIMIQGELVVILLTEEDKEGEGGTEVTFKEKGVAVKGETWVLVEEMIVIIIQIQATAMGIKVIGDSDGTARGDSDGTVREAEVDSGHSKLIIISVPIATFSEVKVEDLSLKTLMALMTQKITSRILIV